MHGFQSAYLGQTGLTPPTIHDPASLTLDSLDQTIAQPLCKLVKWHQFITLLFLPQMLDERWTGPDVAERDGRIRR